MTIRRAAGRAVVMVACGILWTTTAVRAQQEDPPGPFVVDVRIPFVSFKRSDEIAVPLGLRSDQLPRRGLGFEVGAHVYPLRGRALTLGVGATFLRARGEQAPGEDALPTDPTVETRFSALTPQVSLNFGSTGGWSYISGGFGWSRRTIGPASADVPDAPNVGTFNYGGGGRWFVAGHVAFSFDIRWYRVGAQTAEIGVPESPSHTMFAGSVGLSFK
jgi:hypothetical protein